jgi:hypothetical protein
MDRCVGAAAMLPERDRRELAIQALAGSATISELAAGHGVSRKFVYRQTDKARTALGNAFVPAEPENGVLFELAVSQTWLLQLVVALVLICRSSFRGVVEFLRDLLGYPSASAPFTKCWNGPRTRLARSIANKTCPAFAWACTMKSFKAPCRCWPASMPHRAIAIS